MLTMIVIAAAALAACSKSTPAATKTVEIVSTSMAFDTKEVTLDKGATVKMVFNNKDIQLHDLTIDKIPGKVKELEHGAEHSMGSSKPDLHISSDGGKSGSIEFTPSEAGTYTYYCTVVGHKDAGMVGTLIVK